MNQYTKKCQVKILKETIQKLDISDEEYFSDKYAEYTSNSKLKLINPEEGGSPLEYFGPPKKLTTASLAFGSAIHELILQPESFHLSDYSSIPPGKYPELVKKILEYRDQKYSIRDAIKRACIDLDYFAKNKPQTVLKKAPRECLRYYCDLRSGKLNEEGAIYLDNAMKAGVEECLDSYRRSELKPFLELDSFFDPMKFFNEQAIICKILVILPDGTEVEIPFKLKIDNYKVNNTELILNDLKTTGKEVFGFRDQENKTGSYYRFHYYRQLACYLDILKASFDKEYECSANLLVIESKFPYNTAIITATQEELEEGRMEFKDLICRVAYHTVYGTNTEYPES